MVQCLSVGLIIALCVIVLSAGMCFAEAEREVAHPIAEVDASAHYERNWYLAMGTANYHLRLRDSEAQIDRRLNAPLGWLPFWKEPATSKDRRDRFMLWGLSLGIGRDMTSRTSWMLWINGASGAVKNKERYGPVRTDNRFSRTSASLRGCTESPDCFAKLAMTLCRASHCEFGEAIRWPQVVVFASRWTFRTRS